MTKEEETRINAMMAVLQNQRDQAQLQVAQMAAENAVLKTQLEEAQKPKESNVVDIQPAA